MAFTAKDVMVPASTILQDADTVHWTTLELLGYLNEAVRQIVATKPNATSKTVTIDLVTGPKQTLPGNYTVLSRVIGNSVSGKSIRVIDRREILDSQIPGWMNPATLAYAVDVVYVFQDMTDPRTFYVAPGAQATSQITAIVGVMPDPIAAPSNPLDIAAYVGDVELPDIYRNALIDYMIYRAFSKDAGVPGAAARAQGHKTLFDSALGVIASGENAMSLATFAQRGAAAT